MRRRSGSITAAAILGLVLGVLAPTTAGAQDPAPTVSFTPASVPVHGTITITASCPYHGPSASAELSVSFTGQVPAVEAYGFPLLDGGDFVVDLPLRNGAPGDFDVVLACSTLDGGPRVKARTPGLTLTEPSVPRAPYVSIESPYRVAHGDPLAVTATCPATQPAADRVVFRTAPRSGAGVGEPAYQDADLDADGSVRVDVEPPFPDNPAEHVIAVWCLAGDRFLGRGNERTFRVEPAEATTTTAAGPTPSSTPSTTTTAAVAASGAVPVAGSPAYTG